MISNFNNKINPTYIFLIGELFVRLIFIHYITLYLIIDCQLDVCEQRLFSIE